MEHLSAVGSKRVLRVAVMRMSAGGNGWK